MRGVVPSLDGEVTGLTNGVCNANEQPFGSVCRERMRGSEVGRLVDSW